MRTVTLLFADIEGSTGLLAQLGDDYDDLLAHYYTVLREELTLVGGREIATEGDGYFAALDSARGAVSMASAVQRRLEQTSWPNGVTVRARVGLHTGEIVEGAQGPVGMDVHRAARLAAAGHGGQVLLSETVRALVEQHLPFGVRLHDLGSHRLKDISEPVRIQQLVIDGLPERFRPIRTVDVGPPTNLPAEATTFVGREHDVTRLRKAVADHRLVTLTGPGGTGKTRLALRAAASLVDAHADGVWLVELAPVREPDLVAVSILKALDLPESPSREVREQLLDHVRDRQMLLVLDNFEQVIDAATLVAEVLHAAPRVRALVTSRIALHLSGEQEFPVPPLALPESGSDASAASLSQYEAVALFIERAQAARPDFTVDNENAPAVAELMARLDGLPLAIELAAARVKLLAPEAILSRLERRLPALGVGPRDLPKRQQTLKDTIAWSYDLLAATDRRLLTCLAVFVGGWTLDAAEEVCAGEVEVLEGIASLVDHSLVTRREAGGEQRFAMLETIRDFGLEQLASFPDGEVVHDRHARLFLRLAETAAPHLHGPEQAGWIRTLEREHPNMRAALDRFSATGDNATALRMVGALWRFWQKTSVDEGQRRIDGLLAVPDPAADPALRARALEASGGLAYWRGDMAWASRRYEEALAIERRLGDRTRIANAIYNLVFPRVFDSGLEEAGDLAEEALGLFEAAGDEAGVMRARWGLGCVAYFQGRYDVAERELRVSLEAAEKLGDLFHTHWAHHMLGTTYVRLGRLREARPLLAAALTFFADVGDRSAVPLLLDDVSRLAAAEGFPERQTRLAAASQAMQHRSGAELARLSAHLETEVRVDAEAFATAWKEGCEMGDEEAVSYALAGLQ